MAAARNVSGRRQQNGAALGLVEMGELSRSWSSCRCRSRRPSGSRPADPAGPTGAARKRRPAEAERQLRPNGSLGRVASLRERAFSTTSIARPPPMSPAMSISSTESQSAPDGPLLSARAVPRHETAPAALQPGRQIAGRLVGVGRSRSTEDSASASSIGPANSAASAGSTSRPARPALPTLLPRSSIRPSVLRRRNRETSGQPAVAAACFLVTGSARSRASSSLRLITRLTASSPTVTP